MFLWLFLVNLLSVYFWSGSSNVILSGTINSFQKSERNPKIVWFSKSTIYEKVVQLQTPTCYVIHPNAGSCSAAKKTSHQQEILVPPVSNQIDELDIKRNERMLIVVFNVTSKVVEFQNSPNTVTLCLKGCNPYTTALPQCGPGDYAALCAV